MKIKNRNQARGEENKAQLIVIGGLIVAITVVLIAAIIGGGLFSQLTHDDRGLSSFTSQTKDHARAAAQVGQQDLKYVNEYSALFEGAYPNELCGRLVNSTKVQQIISNQLEQGEYVVDIEVEQDCGDDMSWLVGQKNPNYNLPSVNATGSDSIKSERNPVDVVFAIDTTGSMGDDNKMLFTKDGAKAAIDNLKENDKVGLVEYTTDVGTFSWSGSYLNGGAEAKLGGAMNELTGSWPADLKNEIDGFSPDGGTDITTGLDTAKEVLEAGQRADDATQHIVLMTDGKHTSDSNEFANPLPENYIDANEDDYKDIFVHSIVLGDSADIDESVLMKLANKDGIYSDVRPEGTYVQSSDPSDAEDIFKDVIENIEDISNTVEASSTGKVDKIHDVRMNVTDFRGNGTYRMKYVGVDSGGDKEVVWEMVVDNKFIGPDSPLSGRGLGYEVRFTSESNPSLEAKLTVPSSPDPSVPATSNLSYSGEYVWLDLTGKGLNPRFDVGGLTTTEIENELGRSPDAYISEAWQEVKDEAESDGVDIVLEHQGPNGPNEAPFRRGEVKGTFVMEFEPKNGNFTKIGQVSGGNFTADCDSGDTSDSLKRCGMNDSERDAVSTAQIKKVDLLVTVESPNGISRKKITISPDGEYSFDIFGP